MSRHGSKADEATSWRRTTAVSSSDSHHFGGGGGGGKPGGYHPHQRPATADPAVHTSGRGAMQQPLEPVRPPLKEFSAAEAQTLLEKRWAEITQQGLQPACQCNTGADGSGGSSDGEAVQAAADGEATRGGHAFIAALQQAVKAKSADAAWDD